MARSRWLWRFRIRNRWHSADAPLSRAAACGDSSARGTHGAGEWRRSVARGERQALFAEHAALLARSGVSRRVLQPAGLRYAAVAHLALPARWRRGPDRRVIRGKGD